MQMYTANGLYLTYKPDAHLIGIHFACISNIFVGIPCDTLRVYSNTITELSDILNRREKLGYFR